MHATLGGSRVAILAPISHPIPPPGYGPWEQVAFNVAEGLRRRGIDVTAFCSGDSTFEGKRRSVAPVSLAADPLLDADVFSELHIANTFARAAEFDLIHSHLDWRPLCHALSSTSPPLITTIHGFSAPQILGAYYAASRRSFYCSISNADRDPGLRYLSTVYNGIDVAAFAFREKSEGYLLFFGRMHEEKGPHIAIEVARRAARPLVMAGIIHDAAYFAKFVEPHVDGRAVRFVGEVQADERNALLGGADALLQTNTRPERFGLSMIEAMACGTPVIGTDMGSIPEVVAHGETGFVCADVEAAVAAVGGLGKIDRAACRRRVERLFTIDAMVDGYVEAYRAALERRVPLPPTPEQLAARRSDWSAHPVAFTDIRPTPPGLERAAQLIEVNFAR